MIGTRTILMRQAVERFLSLPGVSGNYASVADEPPMDITEALDIRLEAAFVDWTPTGGMTLVAKDNFSPSRQYRFYVTATGTLVLALGNSDNTGFAFESASSTVVPAVDGQKMWVRAVFNPGVDVRYYTSMDGVSWTQLGNTITASVPASIGAAGTTTAPIEIGSYGLGAGLPLNGKVYRAQIYASTDGSDPRLDIDFTRPRVGVASFTEDSANRYLVTINQSGANPARILS